MKILSISVAITILLLSCVSKKQFQRQTDTLNETVKTLNLTVEKQAQITTQIVLLEDSLYKLKKQFNIELANLEYALYKTAIQASDRQLAANSLVRLVELDPAQGYWAYDSLALYHYLYLNTPGMPRQSQSALYFTMKGLEMNPANAFLLETKAKLFIEMQQDSAAYQIFQSLWNKYGDYTYLWQMTYVDLYIFENIKKAEAVIAEVVRNKESEVYKVRIEQIEEHVIETIPAKAAFLYMRGILQNAQGQVAKAKKTMEEVVKIAPNFVSGQRALFQLRNPQYR